MDDSLPMDDDVLDELTLSLMEIVGELRDENDQFEVFELLMLESKELDDDLCHDICRYCTTTRGEEWPEKIVFKVDYTSVARVLACGEIVSRMMAFVSGTYGRVIH